MFIAPDRHFAVRVCSVGPAARVDDCADDSADDCVDARFDNGMNDTVPDGDNPDFGNPDDDDDPGDVDPDDGAPVDGILDDVGEDDPSAV